MIKICLVDLFERRKSSTDLETKELSLRIYDSMNGPSPVKIFHVPYEHFERVVTHGDFRGYWFWDTMMLWTAMLLDMSLDKLKQEKIELYDEDGDQYPDPYGDWSKQ